MTTLDRHIRQQLLREAEGYLELVTVLGERYEVTTKVRENLVHRALKLLRRMKDESQVSDFETLYLEGEALRTLQRYEEAIRPLTAASHRDPTNIHVCLALAWCYKRIARLDMAIESLEEALVVDPTEPILYYNLACYWSLAGNVRQAVRYLAESFDLDPNYRDLTAEESDFDPIRDDPAFQAVTSVIV